MTEEFFRRRMRSLALSLEFCPRWALPAMWALDVARFLEEASQNGDEAVRRIIDASKEITGDQAMAYSWLQSFLEDDPKSA